MTKQWRYSKNTLVVPEDFPTIEDAINEIIRRGKCGKNAHVLVMPNKDG